MRADYDVLIVGGGMVGASLARAVSGQGLKIGVIEAWPYQSQNQPSYDDRVLALSWGTRLILQGMGLWGALQAEAEPIRDIHISDRGHFGFARLNHRDEGVEALGYVVTARDLGQVLLQGLEALDDIDLLCPAILEGFTQQASELMVEIERSGRREQLSARLLVAADGGDSKVRRLLDLPSTESSYGQTALIANVTPERPHQGVAYERFTDSGPLAMLPMSGGRCSLVWTARDEQVDELLSLDDAAFLARLQARFGYRLGRMEKVGERLAYPLKLRRVKELVRPRIAFAGNAAHTLHPVTGQGFNLGLRDVAALAEILADAARQQADPGSEENLRRYVAWRQADQDRVSFITDSLARLFANPFTPVRMARNLGLLGLDLTPGLKHLVARQFMGLNGRLPRLARGVSLVRQ
jgi:2-octaprenyl-6-methoxyphenol hydroxylase